MKKLLCLVVAVIISLPAISQIKHNKFATGIKFAKFNPTFPFWNTYPSEIKDQSGYFLTNRYDDQVGGVNPSLVKLDIEGNIVFDSIYDFTPINAGGFTNIHAVTTSSTSHTALYQTSALSAVSSVSNPYVINFDLNGNLNWHIGFTDDTLDLEVSSIINTQDGGYAIVGSMFDWQFAIKNPAGLVIKLDNAGNLLWHNIYGNKDTMEIHFRAAIETPDAGLFVVGDAPNFVGGQRTLNSWDVPIAMSKMDNAGNVLWSKAMKLAYPIDPQSVPNDFSVGMINNSDAFVSYAVYDTTSPGFNRFAISSVNVNNGNTNWTKVYALSAGQEVSLRQAVTDGNGNIVVSASDYNLGTGVLFHLDNQGNLLSTKRFSTLFPTAGNFPYGTIATADGGFLHVSEIDQNDVLVVKTDENLDPSCANIDSIYPHLLSPTVNFDTSYFGIVDTVYTLPGLNPVTLTGGTPFNSVADDSLICSCSNVIQGNVIEGGVTPVNNADVFLYRKGMIPDPWSPIDSTVTDAAGFYQFNYVPTDSFIVRVEADTLLFPGAMTSYHKDIVWCYRWDSAGVFSVHCDSGTVVKDVELVVTQPLNGGSSLNGYVFESTGSFNRAPGDPIPGIDITVDQSPSGIVGGSTTAGNGYYSLSGLDTGATYIVTIDMPGLPHDSVWTVSINLSDTIMDSLNFYIDSTGIYILEDSFGVGIDVMETYNLDVDLYPNPTSGLITVQIDALKPEEVELQLTNGVGKVISTVNYSLMNGQNNIIFDETVGLSPGIYFLKIREGSNFHIKKIIKQ